MHWRTEPISGCEARLGARAAAAQKTLELQHHRSVTTSTNAAAAMPPKPPLNWGLLPPPFLLPSSTTSSSPFLAITARRSIKSINTPHPDRFAHNPNLPALSATTAAALERKAATLPLRSGALAIKRGMTALYDAETGKRTPCTVLQLERNEVVALKTRPRHGYWAVQVGAGWKHPSNVTRPLLGHYAKAGVSPKRWVAEFRVKGEAGLVEVGEAIGAGWFKEGQFVDARSKSRGMGFEGVSGSPACIL